MTESELQSAILMLMRAKGFTCWRVQTQGTWDAKGQNYRPNPTKGMADIIGISSEGRFFAIEVKSKKGILSDEQVKFLDSVRKNNGIAITARSLDDVAKEFQIEKE